MLYIIVCRWCGIKVGCIEIKDGVSRKCVNYDKGRLEECKQEECSQEKLQVKKTICYTCNEKLFDNLG